MSSAVSSLNVDLTAASVLFGGLRLSQEPTLGCLYCQQDIFGHLPLLVVLRENLRRRQAMLDPRGATKGIREHVKTNQTRHNPKENTVSYTVPRTSNHVRGLV
jgi:hypothetical protein